MLKTHIPRSASGLSPRKRDVHTVSAARLERRHGRVLLGVFGALIALAACGGGGAAPVDLSASSTKVQVANDGFSFPNFPSSSYNINFEAEDVTAMFGSGPSVCVSGADATCQLTAEASTFARMVNQARASGHCDGLVAVALTRFNAAAAPATVKLPDQNETIRTVMRAFATQFVPEVQADVKKWLGKSLKEKISALTTSFKTGKLEYTLGVYTATGGHAMLPYAVEYPSKDSARIMVYDSNWPGKNRYVEVDLAAETWKFSFSGEDPANDPDAWTGSASKLDLTATETRAGSCPFCGDGTKATSTTMLVRTANIDWSVEVDGEVLKPGSDPSATSGAVIQPVKASQMAEMGFVGAKDNRSSFNYFVVVPNVPAKPGETKKRDKLSFSGTTSLFAVTSSGIAQITTPGNAKIPVEVGENSIVSKDPNVELTLASGNLVATASGPGASLETSADGNMQVSVTTANGQVVKQEVTPESPAAKVTADATGGVVALVASSTGEVIKREVSSSGVETKTVSTETLDLTSTTYKAAPGLESKAIEALPSLEKRNLANPDYKADAAYVAPAPITKNKALEPTKTSVGKFNIESATFGDAPFTLTAPSSNSDSSFTYTSSNTGVATVSSTSGKVTIVSAGTTTITASQEATTNFTASTTTASLKVAKGVPKFGVFSLPKKSFGEESFVVNAPSSTSTSDISFETSNDAVAKINSDSGKVTIVGAGTTTITASQTSNANYEAASVKTSLVVAKNANTFAARTLADVTFGAVDFDVAPPTSKSTVPFTFTSTTPEVLTVDSKSGKVRVVGAGAGSIAITQASSANYDSATQAVAVKVLKAVPTIKVATVLEKDFGVEDFTIDAPTTVSSGKVTYASLTPEIATVDSVSGKIKIVGAGTAKIQVTVAGTENYEPISRDVTFEAQKAKTVYGVFTLEAVDATIGTVQIKAPKSSNASDFTYESSDKEVATVKSTTGLITVVGAGSADIKLSQVASANFKAGAVSASLVVSRVDPKLQEFTVAEQTFGDLPFEPVAPKSTSDGVFTFASSNSEVATVNSAGKVVIVGTGNTNITATQAKTGKYNASSSVKILKVVKATPVYGAFALESVTATIGTVQVVPPTSSSPVVKTYSSSNTDVVTVNSTTGLITVLGAGTTDIKVSQVTNANYEAGFKSASLVITRAAPLFGQFSIANAIYGSAPLTVTPPFATSDGAFTFASSAAEVATVNNSGNIVVVGAGETTITATQAQTAKYNSGTVQATLIIDKANPVYGSFSLNSVSANIGTVQVTAPSSTSTATKTFASSNTSVATINSATGLITVLAPGTSSITVSQASNTNYNAGSVTALLTVNQSTFTVRGTTDFYFTYPEAHTFTVRSYAWNLHRIDSMLWLYNADTGVQLAANDDYFGLDSYLSYNMQANVRYRLRGGICCGNPDAWNDGVDGFYTLSVDGSAATSLTASVLGDFNVSSNATAGLRGTRYVGYFADNVNWFSTATPQGQTNTMTDFTYFTSGSDQYSWQWLGMFVAPSTATYSFCTDSDDASYVWLGANATTGFTTSNSVVNNGGLHGPRTVCGSISLSAGTSYPIRVQFGENGGGDFIKMWYSTPTLSSVYNGAYFTGDQLRVGSANFFLTAPSSTSNGAFTYYSSDTSVATVNATTGEVAIVGAGSTSIKALQAATNTYAGQSVSKVITVKSVCESGGVCAVGDTGPGGGKVFYVSPTTFTSSAACGSSCKYLEAAPTGWGSNVSCWGSDTPGTSLRDPRCMWSGDRGTSVVTGSGIGAGFGNTSTILANNSLANFATSVARAYQGGGKTDWSLPSKAELNELCKFARNQTTGTTSQICANTGSLRSGFEGFYYWSSYEAGDRFGWLQDFFDGNDNITDYKNKLLNVRPIRAF